MTDTTSIPETPAAQVGTGATTLRQQAEDLLARIEEHVEEIERRADDITDLLDELNWLELPESSLLDAELDVPDDLSWHFNRMKREVLEAIGGEEEAEEESEKEAATEA